MNMIIISSSEEEKISEALRLCAAMIGMDEPPLVVFRGRGVNCLKQGTLEDASNIEYLQTISDLAGVYYLKEAVIENKTLDSALDPIPVNIHEFVDYILECKTAVTF